MSELSTAYSAWMISFAIGFGALTSILTVNLPVAIATDQATLPRACICEFYAAGVSDDEYVVVRSLSDDDIDLRGWSIFDGEGAIVFGSESLLPARGSAIVSFNSSSYSSVYGRSPDYSVDITDECARVDVVGSFRLADDGDSIALRDADWNEVDYVPYGDDVPRTENWSGAALACPRRGEVLRRVADHPDTDSSQDWRSFREYKYGYSEHEPLFCRVDPGCLTAFVSPDCSLDVVLERLASASNSIRLCAYELESTSVFQALADAVDRGVDVHVLLEGNPVGGMSSRQVAILSALTVADVEVTTVFGNLREGVVKHIGALHPKYAVLDDEELIVLSENFVPDGLPADEVFGNRGWGVAVRCPELACYMGNVFDDDSRRARPDTVDWAEDERFNESPSVPLERRGSETQGLLAPLVSSTCAELRLLVSPDCSIEAPFLCEYIDGAWEILVQQFQVDLAWETRLPDDGSLNPLIERLMDRLREGASCLMLLDSSWFNLDRNSEVIRSLTAVAVVESLNGSFRMISERSPITVMHNKGVLLDDAVAVVSSNNWGFSSFARNRELAAVVRSPEVARYFARAFDLDWHPDVSPPSLVHNADVSVARGEWVCLSSDCFTDDRLIATHAWDIGCDGSVDSRRAEIMFYAGLPGVSAVGLTVADAWGNEANTILNVRVIASPAPLPPETSPRMHVGLAIPPVLVITGYLAFRRRRARRNAAHR